MKKGVIKINLNDLMDYEDRSRLMLKQLDDMQAARNKAVDDLNFVQKDKEELENLYNKNRAQIDDMNKRKHANSLYEYAKYHTGLLVSGISETTFNLAMSKLAGELNEKQDNDDLPF